MISERTPTKILTGSLLVAVGIGLAALYLIVDPATAAWMPKCVFLHLTGLECPGCGSQRAIHALLHGELSKAWGFNPLVVAGLPIMLLMGIAALLRKRYPKLYIVLNSTWAAVIASVAIVAWFLIRNFIL